MLASIYIHLPFCKTKCPYCDFASEVSSPLEFQSRSERYLERLFQEMDFRMMRLASIVRPRIDTVYFGGGTPSLQEVEHIARILEKISTYCDLDEQAEISLETNPGTVDAIKLREFKAIGINRISVGVQTFDEDLLLKLGRGHSLKDTRDCLDNIIEIDFNSWSLDLIYGLPAQSLESWEHTLQEALSYQPPHISAYALSIEAATPYGAYYRSSQHPELPQEDSLVSMYQLTNNVLGEAGLLRYEISNWAKPNHESRHNLAYWLAQEYLALGVGAHGYLSDHRYANPKSLNDYYSLDFEAQAQEFIDLQEHKIETILLGLRLERGLSLSPELEAYIQVSKLEEFEKLALIELESSSSGPLRIKLTNKGILLSNRVIAELIETDVVRV